MKKTTCIKDPPSEIKERILFNLRGVELQERFLLLASTFEGFQLQAKDAACLGIMLGCFTDKIRAALKENVDEN